MNSSKQIRLGALLSYTNITVNIILGLVYTPWMIHSIGRENYGLYILATSVITLFVFDFGLSAAVTRFVAKYIAEGNNEKANNVIGLVYRLYFVIDAVLLVLLVGIYFFIPQIYQELTPEEVEKFKVVYVIAASYSVAAFPFIPIGGIISAYEKFVQLRLCDLAHKLIKVGLMTGCLLLGYGLYALVIVNAIAGVITILLKLYVIYRYTPQKPNFSYRNKHEFRQVISYSGWTTVIAIAGRLILKLAPSILGIYSGSAAIAILGVAITIDSYTYMFASAISGMFLPRVSRIVAHEKGNVLPLLNKVGRLQLMVVGAIVVGFACLGHDFILLWVGEKFEESYLCTLILVAAMLYTTPHEIANQNVYAQNKVKEMGLIHLGSSLFNVVLYFVLAKPFGPLGIAIAVFVSLVIRTVLMEIMYYKKLAIDIIAFLKETFLKIGSALIGAYLLYLAFDVVLGHKLFILTWSSFAIKSIVFMAIYAACVCFILNDYEKSLFKSMIGRML